MFAAPHVRYGALRFTLVNIILLARVPLVWRLRREIADLIGVVRQHRPALPHGLVVTFVLFGPMLFALYPLLTLGTAFCTLCHVLSLPRR